MHPRYASLIEDDMGLAYASLNEFESDSNNLVLVAVIKDSLSVDGIKTIKPAGNI